MIQYVDESITLNQLAEEVKRVIEVRLDLRLTLVTIDPVAEKFNLFHLPSTTTRRIEYADRIAREVYPSYKERILALTTKAD